MKSFLLLIALLVSVSAEAQERLVFQAKITMHDTGSWSGFSKWYPSDSYGGADTLTFVVWYNDTLSIIGDSVSQAVRDEPDWEGSYQSHASGVFDPKTNIIHNLEITGGGSYSPSPDGEIYNFTISIDSLHTEQLSGSVLAVTPGTYTCQTTSKYSWNHSGGPESGDGGSDITGSSGSGSGSGPTDFVVLSATSGVSSQNSTSAFHIAYLGGGAVQIEGLSNSPNEQIDIFDELGRRIFHTRFDGNSVIVSNLNSGCYFARMGSMNLKFFVSE